MTKGEARVRVEFNVTGSGAVDSIKKKTADLIDDCDSLLSVRFEGDRLRERERLVALAQTHYETAAMYAVKAATG